MNQNRLANSGFLIVLSLSALLAMAGCAHTPAQIIPVSNFDAAALSTEDIVQVMLQAGFSDEQIVEFGTDLRNELALSGAAQINVGDKAEAIFAIRSDYLYVSSYHKGSFIYDLTKESVVNNNSTFAPNTAKAVNDKPKANDYSATTLEDMQVSIALTGNDPDGDPLTYSVVTGPSHGNLSGTAPRLTYTPNTNFYGSDNFTFNVNDGTVDSVSATVSITVTPINDPPVANDYSVETLEDMQVSIALTGYDPDGDPLTYNVVKGPSHGNLSGTAPKLTYTPSANFNGSDNFTFNVNDGTMDSVSATVSIMVTPINDPPVADDCIAKTQENMQVSMSLALLGNDPDGDPLTYNVVKGPSHGKLSGTAPRLTYTPNTNFYGSDNFTFNVNDGTVDSVSATVSITVTPINDPPVANDYSVETYPSHENLSGTSPKLTYTPNTDFKSVDTFTYTVQGGKTDTGTVQVTINAINDKPAIISTAVTTATVGELYAYDVNAEDIEGDTLTYSLTTKPAGMTIDPATGLIEWTPTNANNSGAYDVLVKVADGDSIPVSDTQLFTITVGTKSLPHTLFIVDGYNHRNRKTLSADGKTELVGSSDDKRLVTSYGSYTSYDFSYESVPADALLKSVVVYIEHFEEEHFASGKLEWAIGTGWPRKPVVWASIDAPINEDENHEAVDSWDITSLVDTRDKLNSLQLQIKNNDIVGRKNTLINHIYLVVEWD